MNCEVSNVKRTHTNGSKQTRRKSDNASLLQGRLLLLGALLVAMLSASHKLFAQTDTGPENAADQPVIAAPEVGNPTETESEIPGSNTDDQKSAIPASPLEVVEAMGIPFTVVFAIASIIAVWSAIERLVMLRRRRVIPRAFVDRFLMHLRTGRMEKIEAITVCQQNRSPVADVFLHGVRKWGKSSVEIEQAVIDGGEREVSLLKKRLRVLNGVATITPLIGLLGTVIGMIQAFNDIATADAMGQAQQLARGIAMALLTTATGLFIAIPALTAYMYLAGRIDSLVLEMDRLGQELVHLISAEALRERSAQMPDPSTRVRRTETTANAQPEH